MRHGFGEFTLDTLNHELRHRGELVPTEPQVFSLLQFLAENPGRTVSKDELIKAVWDGRIISDATLSSRIHAARQAIGDNGTEQRAIRTVPRRGFRFMVSVETETVPASPRPLDDADIQGIQDIRYCATPDGVTLAYSLAGTGPVLVKTANWLNHLEQDWRSPMWAPLFHELAGYRCLLRYDTRGVGMSDWDIGDIDFDRMAVDLETVIDASGVSEFALLGISQGAAVAIDYAVRHPERVTRLILWGGFARGRRKRGQAEEIAESEAFTTLIRQGWGKTNSTFRQMFAALYLPEATNEQVRWWTDMQRVASSPENAVRLREAIDVIDISEQLAMVRTPTLILHSVRESVAPLSEARFMAARIPQARLVTLDSANHVVVHQEPAWRHALDEIRAFLDNPR